MNVIKLAGGLGNQLFQYAFGRAMMEFGTEVRFDPSWYNRPAAINSGRKYVLDKFQIDVQLANAFGCRLSEAGFDKSHLRKDGFYFSGYWQYPAYSTKILPILRQELKVKKEIYTREFLIRREQIILDDYSVAIHVRRGDYLLLDGFPVQPIEYYKKAMERIQGNYYVFSDDIPWCRENFKDVRFIHLTDYFDFELMKLCKHQIASRSSFSWWAAYLNDNPNKIVIIPKEQIHCKVRQRVSDKEQEIFDPKEWVHVD